MKSSITDIPRDVKRGEKDNFGITPFEKGLTRFINHTNTPITIALQGEWGSGKTSLMNSLNQNLSINDNSKFHSIWLNTWEYALMKDAQSTLIDIITGLIQEVSKIANIDATKTKKILNKLWSIGKTTAKFAAKTAANKVVEGSSELVDSLYTESGSSSIGEIRDELEKVIQECINKDNKQGFIFFIDDLDRIDPPVAVELLELLKNIFTLKNCVFILAIDYDVVVKGLEPKFGKISASNEREFRSFFDKIIQVPFSMPVSSYRIDDFLKNNLKSINYLTDQQIDNDELISKFSEISSLTVGSNPRALKRLLNSLSLISCINSAKGNAEEDHLDEDIELLVNFTLVSIQIAYPPIYRLLSIHSGFDKWNENVAMQFNLKPLDQASVEKLNSSEEFDEVWEKVLFRLCENDHYLKKKSLNISRLLNNLKTYVIEKGEDIEDIITSVISLSSVTNIEAFDKPVVDYHRGRFLKRLRNLIIPKLKEQLPEIAPLIKKQGKRVQSNAYIKFTEHNWGNYIKLSSHPHEGQVRLLIISHKRVLHAGKTKNIQQRIEQLGLKSEFEIIEKEYNQFTDKYSGFTSLNLYEEGEKRKGYYEIDLYAYYSLPNTENFFEERHLLPISNVIKDMYHFLVRLQEIKNRVEQNS